MCVGFKGEKQDLFFLPPFLHGYEKIGGMSADENDIVKAKSDYNKIYKQSENILWTFLIPVQAVSHFSRAKTQVQEC